MEICLDKHSNWSKSYIKKRPQAFSGFSQEVKISKKKLAWRCLALLAELRVNITSSAAELKETCSLLLEEFLLQCVVTTLNFLATLLYIKMPSLFMCARGGKLRPFLSEPTLMHFQNKSKLATLNMVTVIIKNKSVNRLCVRTRGICGYNLIICNSAE